MKKRVFFLLLILNAISCFSQEGFRDGYIITNKNEKVYGKIRDRKRPYSVNSWQKIIFINNKGEREKLRPDDLNGYVMNDTIVYQTLALGIEERKTFVKKIENGAIIIFADMKSSVPQRVDVGPSSFGPGIYINILFGKVQQHIDGDFYLQTQNDPRTLMEWRAKDYKMTAKYFFREDKDLVKQIEEDKYGYSDLQTIVRIYNEWKIKQ